MARIARTEEYFYIYNALWRDLVGERSVPRRELITRGMILFFRCFARQRRSSLECLLRRMAFLRARNFAAKDHRKGQDHEQRSLHFTAGPS